jgi:hypothetical protein
MISRFELATRLEKCAEKQDIASGLEFLAAFVGAEHYLLARYDVFSEDGYDYVVAADWPFDLVRSLGAHVTRLHAKRNEVDRCMASMEPDFQAAGAAIRLPLASQRAILRNPLRYRPRAAGDGAALPQRYRCGAGPAL